MNDQPPTDDRTTADSQPELGGLDAAGLLLAGIATPSGGQATDAAEIAEHFPNLEVLGLLGEGGMGVVYKARQRTLDRIVALKVLPPRDDLDAGFSDRFAREARALARLDHPNIVRVHEFGEEDGLFYLVMEYVEGVTLRDVIEGHEMAPTQALSVVPQICDALQYAHDQGVVHRDIKPENVLLGTDGAVKIADFGLAKIVGAVEDRTLTRHGQVMGTLHYMAPEQIEHPGDVDHRADIYSLGVVFYELLTGELPIGRFDPPSERVQVDVRLDRVVLRALQKRRDQRYQRASDVKTDVSAVSSGRAPAIAAAAAEVAASERAARSQPSSDGAETGVATTAEAVHDAEHLARLSLLGIPAALGTLLVALFLASVSSIDHSVIWFAAAWVAAISGMIGFGCAIRARIALQGGRGSFRSRHFATAGIVLPMLLLPFGVGLADWGMNAQRQRERAAQARGLHPVIIPLAVGLDPDRVLTDIRALIDGGLDHIATDRGMDGIDALYASTDAERIAALPESELAVLRKGWRLGLPLVDRAALRQPPHQYFMLPPGSIHVDSEGREATVNIYASAACNDGLRFSVVNTPQGWRFAARPAGQIVNPGATDAPPPPPAHAVRGGPATWDDADRDAVLEKLLLLMDRGIEHAVAGRGLEAAADLYVARDMKRLRALNEQEFLSAQVQSCVGLPLMLLRNIHKSVSNYRTNPEVALSPDGRSGIMRVHGGDHCIGFHVSRGEASSETQGEDGWRFEARPVEEAYAPDDELLPPTAADVRGGPDGLDDAARLELLDEILRLTDDGLVHAMSYRGKNGLAELYAPADAQRLLTVEDAEMEALRVHAAAGLPLITTRHTSSGVSVFRRHPRVDLSADGEQGLVVLFSADHFLSFHVVKTEEGWRFAARPVATGYQTVEMSPDGRASEAGAK